MTSRRVQASRFHLQMITHAWGLEHPSQLARAHVLVNFSRGVRKPRNRSRLGRLERARDDMNPYLVLGSSIGTTEAASLCARLAAWHESAVVQALQPLQRREPPGFLATGRHRMIAEIE